MFIFSISCFLLYLFSVSCSTKPSTRIIGGASARAGQFPFLAGISKTTSNGHYFCSGTLINNDWVLTAGQCVDGATLLTITLGTHTLNPDEENAEVRVTDLYVLHPDYNPQTLENDIGLIKFRNFVYLNDYIRPIYLFTTTPIPEGALVLTMGWGHTSDDDVDPVKKLHYVYLTTISNDECKITYGPQITDSMVCVAGSYNQGTCLGDSGSPLIQYTATDNPYHIGISSFYSGKGCETTDPSGFTRTAPYVDWIQNVTTTYRF